jgi:hypothetical protein
MPSLFCKTFEAIPGYHLHVVQSDCSHAVLLKPLVDLIEVITDDLLLSIYGPAWAARSAVKICPTGTIRPTGTYFGSASVVLPR